MLVQILEEKRVPAEPLSDYINAFRYFASRINIWAGMRVEACRALYEDSVMIRLCSWSVEYRGRSTSTSSTSKYKISSNYFSAS